MTAYYNENDQNAAAWLRELIRQNLITDGVVDERSIREVEAKDVAGFERVHFFAGIGGWDIALNLAGWGDDRPVWTGSCPCQPFSAAGKRKGTADERHLWPEFRRLIEACQPAVCLGEQVASKDGRVWLAGVFADLEALGYRRAGADLCAAGVGAPHIRQRFFWVAESRQIERGWRPSVERSCVACAAERCEEAIDDQRSGTACGLPDATGERRSRRASGSTESTGRGSFEDDGDDRWLQHSASNGRDEGRAESVGGSAAGGCCDGGGVGDADDSRLEGRRLLASGRPGERSACTTSVGHWSDSIIVPCGDRKKRRLKPGLEPLVNGLHGRASLLRGYGNAIVPEVAAEFVKAYLDCRMRWSDCVPECGNVTRR